MVEGLVGFFFYLDKDGILLFNVEVWGYSIFFFGIFWIRCGVNGRILLIIGMFDWFLIVCER